MKELIERLRNDCYQEDEVRAHAKEAADALERMAFENAQLQKDYTRIKESATLWHDRYKTKCQESVDRQAILGAEIVALEAERDSLKEGLDGWHSRYLDCEVERDALKEQMTTTLKVGMRCAPKLVSISQEKRNENHTE